jgi:hypothetical protein
MSRSQWIGILMLAAVFAAGGWLLWRPGELQPETAVRQQAMRQVLAPQRPSGGLGNGFDQNDRPIAHEPVEPALLSLAGLPAASEQADGMYQRWRRGELDLDVREGFLSRAELLERQEAARRLPHQPLNPEDGVRPLAVASGVAFDSLDYSVSGGSTPPDPELAVGPNHIIAVVNVAFRIYDKSGAPLSPPILFASLFGALPGCNQTSQIFDPNVLYDEAADRFILAIDQQAGNTPGSNQSHYCLAVSVNGDPTGSWYGYKFSMNNSNSAHWMDYPHAGVGRDAIYMGGNMFTLGGFFAGSRVWAFNKVEIYNGAAATPRERAISAIHGTPQPIKLHGFAQGSWPNDNRHYILAEKGYDGRTHTLFAWRDPFGANTFTQVSEFNLDNYTGVTTGFPPNAPQSGGGAIQTNDHRPLDFEYRNGYGWTTAVIGCNDGGGSAVNCVRWAQIALSSGAVVQAGVIRSPGQHRYFPDLAVNHCNDMLVGYTKSSEASYPGIWYAGREAGDTPGTLRAELQLKGGETAYQSFDSAPYRWGDYTGMTIDPDGQTFWYLGEYSKNINANAKWGTYVGSVQFNNCVAPVLSELIHLPLITNPAAAAPLTTVPNGNFEAGRVHWQEFSQGGWALIMENRDNDPTPVTPRSGRWLAWLGGGANEIAIIQQEITISSANPYLTYYYWAQSSVADCNLDRNWVIWNEAVVDYRGLCQANQTAGWTKQTVDLSGYAGQTGTLKFRVDTSGTTNSSLYLDDISLESGP